MKKIFLALFLSATSMTYAQTIDTTFKQSVAVKVKPFKAKFNDTDSVCYLSIQVSNDNLKDNCGIRYSVYSANKMELASGYLEIKGDDYKTYADTTINLFLYVGKFFSLTFLKP